MTAPPLVSVVIPFLDAARFLDETVQSVLAQTYPAWELWLVDDGSTDAGTELARSYAARDERVHYLEHEGHANRGISASRNLGIRHARGEFLALLDADDVFRPEKLERQVAILRSHPDAALVYGKSEYWFSWTGDADAHDRVQEHWIAGECLLHPPRGVTLHLIGRAAVPCPCSVLARTEIVRAIGGFEESFRGMHEDQVFYAKMCLVHPVFVSDLCLDRYRQHEASICSVTERDGDLHLARRHYLEWLTEYLVACGVQDDELWTALRQEVWLAREQPSLAPGARDRRHLWDKWTLRLEAALLPTVLRRALWRRRVPALAAHPSRSTPTDPTRRAE